MACETPTGANDVTGAAVALPMNARAVASSSVYLVRMSAGQILDLKRLEVRDRLRACLMVEVMSRTVTE